MLLQPTKPRASGAAGNTQHEQLFYGGVDMFGTEVALFQRVAKLTNICGYISPGESYHLTVMESNMENQ